MPSEVEPPLLRATDDILDAAMDTFRAVNEGKIDAKSAREANKATDKAIASVKSDLRARAASTAVRDAAKTTIDAILSGVIDARTGAEANKAMTAALKAAKANDEIAPHAPQKAKFDEKAAATVETVKAMNDEIKSRMLDATAKPAAPDVRNIDVDLIDPSFHARPIVPSAVAELADSMREIGLLSPIVVRAINASRFETVAGHHRHAAAKSLGWKTVQCKVVVMDDLRAEMAELDENLKRLHLSPAQEAVAISRRKAIYETLHPETKGGVAGGHARHGSATDNLSFAAATAQSIGRDERTVRRAATRGETLGDDLKAIANTSLDKGVELDALAKLPPEERAPLIQKATAGENVSARNAGASNAPKAAKVDAEQSDFDNVEKRQTATSDELKALMRAWNQAGPEARKIFLHRVNAFAG